MSNLKVTQIYMSLVSYANLFEFFFDDAGSSLIAGNLSAGSRDKLGMTWLV